MEIVDFMDFLDNCKKKNNLKLISVCDPIDNTVLFFGFNEEDEHRYKEACKVMDCTNKTESVLGDFID